MPAQTAIHGFLENTGIIQPARHCPNTNQKTRRFRFVLGKLRFINNSSLWPYQP